MIVPIIARDAISFDKNINHLKYVKGEQYKHVRYKSRFCQPRVVKQSQEAVQKDWTDYSSDHGLDQAAEDHAWVLQQEELDPCK